MSLGGSRKEKSALDAPETSVQPCQHADFSTATCLRRSSRTGLFPALSLLTTCIQSTDSKSHVPALIYHKIKTKVSNFPCTANASVIMPGLSQDSEFIKKL